MNTEYDSIVERARRFSQDIVRSRVADFEENGVSKEVIQQMAEQGFLRSIFPIEYGGLAVDALTYGRITEEIGKGCNSVRALLTVHTSLVGETVAKLGSDEQKQTFLPVMASGEKIACFALSEPEAGSDAASIQTSYQEFDDHYVINGTKKWITYGGVADLFLVFASKDEKTSAFIVERNMPGVTTSPMSGLMASRGAHLAEISFENVSVPKLNMLGRAGMGFSFVANTALFYGRYSIAWGGLAIICAALEEMVTYSRSRVQFGTKISQNQLIKAMIADSTTSLHAGRAMCEKIAEMRIKGDQRAVTETNIAKYLTSKAAAEVSSNAVQIFGGNGIWNSYAVERLFREAKVLEIIEGTSQIQQLMIAGQALRDYYRVALKKHYPNSKSASDKAGLSEAKNKLVASV
ncbi:MAG: acyl-CoA dehydrogenase family protein [Kangiellaceae bacterium]|nr:acyl-CoA dehydrogenase family protein [Kangiellaceae bacterium]MCW8999236.1 acyl-CoA dehydrogenase family protein [Kangiellaceae bacterium]MCW9015911.1 acyl-CoA dehydrogenase family protein [Kangiellaceae bacterium]